jgi:outer membrane receptor for monomeric catechols
MMLIKGFNSISKVTVDGQDDIQTNRNDHMNVVIVVVIKEWNKNSRENEIRMKDE